MMSTASSCTDCKPLWAKASECIVGHCGEQKVCSGHGFG